ncbi:hypothetical protein CEE69_29895 [Rhodopirellula bahusiensis]|uniref:Uncharacterized protein n=1 Tax=Rhodopirellula bahusiensis TaxID=2014065 RepID=A0A2G1VY28_9BACT|nr:hypothetical protein CEE69_29895 [Rhodopirellula bahusiensis]
MGGFNSSEKFANQLSRQHRCRCGDVELLAHFSLETNDFPMFFDIRTNSKNRFESVALSRFR